MTHQWTAPKAALILALAAAPNFGFADDTHTRTAAPENHAPIGVMGDHRHKAGEYMVSLRQMNMRMEGNIHGRDKVSDSEVLAMPNQHGMPANLRVVPQKMDMEMTMLGAMYAPNDTITLLAMVMQIDNDMVLQSYQGMMGDTPCASTFVSKTSGTGDTIIGALFRGGATSNGQWHSGLAVSLPTGAIDKIGRPMTPMGCAQATMDMRLPYPMQLGSGSYELKPSLTYTGDWQKWGGWRVGAQANATLRLNDNDEDYRLGDKFEMQGWAMKNLTPYASASLRLDASHQGKMDGRDAAISLPVPTAQSRSSGGTYANLSLGINLIGQSGVLRDHRLALEYVMPVHQDANGVQMKRDETLTLGWQKAF
jgi:hypothetical protein